MKHSFVPEQLTRLEYWIAERERMRLRYERHKEGGGQSSPTYAKLAAQGKFSMDPHMNGYRYCNVIRMDDRVSKWLFKEWYPQRKGTHHGLMVLATIARLINEPGTLEALDSCIPVGNWLPANEKLMAAKLTKLEQSAGDHRTYGNAYLVVGTEFTDGKRNAIPRIVTRVSKANVQPMVTMAATHYALTRVHGLGSFLAGQIVADVRHCLPRGYWGDSKWWAPLGPGSARGMARLLGREVTRRGLNQDQFLALLKELFTVVKLPTTVTNRMEAMDLQNCLCEFDKFSRLFEGRRPRRLYP